MSVKMNNIVYTALVTPMLDDGKIDFISFEKLLRGQEKANCGVVVLGSTGEALALNYEEQCQVVTFASSLNLVIPLLVGVGGYQLGQQLRWVGFCNQQNIDGFLMLTPIYAKPGTQGQIAWFKALLDHTKKPCMLYNVPSRTGVNLCFDAFLVLKEHPNLWALKEASGDVDRFKRYVNLAPQVVIYSGEDAMMPVLAKVGGKGLVSVVSNIWPKQTKAYVASALAYQADNKLCALWQQVSDACFSVSNPIPTKVWLAHSGKITTSTLRLPLVAEELAGIEQLKKADDQINTYYEGVLF